MKEVEWQDEPNIALVPLVVNDELEICIKDPIHVFWCVHDMVVEVLVRDTSEITDWNLRPEANDTLRVCELLTDSCVFLVIMVIF